MSIDFKRPDSGACRTRGKHCYIDDESDLGYGALRALDPKTGNQAWEYRMQTKPWSGVLSTAGRLVFGATGGWINRSERSAAESYFFALDAGTGKELWRINLGGEMASNPMTYETGGRQYVVMPAGGALFAFTLPDAPRGYGRAKATK